MDQKKPAAKKNASSAASAKSKAQKSSNSGIELKEAELSQVSGGLPAVQHKIS
jgi:hypothetical protein